MQTATTDRRTGSEYTTNAVAYCLDRSGGGGGGDRGRMKDVSKVH